MLRSSLIVVISKQELNYCPMKTHYAFVVLFFIVLCVLKHHDKGKDKRFHFVEMSEREGSFSLLV